MTVMPVVDLGNGSLLVARAEIDHNIVTEMVVRSSSVVPFLDEARLVLDYKVRPVDPHVLGELSFDMIATNTGISFIAGLMSLRPSFWL